MLPTSPMSEAQRVAIPQADLNAVAHSLAYEYTTGFLECNCVYVGESDGFPDWFELPSAGADADTMALIAECVQYLDVRGLVARHPHNENWIALADESEAAR